MQATVLVTGGSGFIGTWVLHELLKQNARVVVVDVHRSPDRLRRVLGERSSEVRWADASLLERDQIQAVIEEKGITHIIHLAALLTPACQQDPLLGCQVNVLGSTTIFDAARRAGTIQGIAYASSYAVYGSEAVGDDASSHSPPMFYGVFKKAVDWIAEQYWRHYKLSSIAIRPHVVYGPERDQGLTAGPSLAARAAGRGESYTIGYTGTVSYDYVEDVAAAFVRGALECPQGATVVDLPGAPASTEVFVRTIESVVPEAEGKITINGPAIPVNIPPSPYYIHRVYPDWKPTPLEEGVRKTVAFYRR